MLLKVSWRNIWRSPVRSLVVMGAITIGVWAVIFLSSFSVGMIKAYVSNAIQNELSHIQLHHPDFLEDRDIQFYMEDASVLSGQLESYPEVESVASRSLAFGMISSSKGAQGIEIRGIDPANESMVTHLDDKLVEGTYLSADQRNPILIGKLLADKMNLKLRSKIVLTFQDTEKEIIAASFRIKGIYETKNALFDENNVFILKTDLVRFLEKQNIAHEMAIVLKDFDELQPVLNELKSDFSNLDVQSYRTLSPDVDLYESQINVSSIIFMTIVMMALFFGIINSMLMAVLERFRELGMLMAIGMNKRAVFGMIILETVILSSIGAIVGIILGFLTVRYFGIKGLDLSAFSKGMREFGLSEYIHTSLNSEIYIQLATAVIITALIGAVYPAIKAIQLKPIEAIRKL